MANIQHRPSQDRDALVRAMQQDAQYEIANNQEADSVPNLAFLRQSIKSSKALNNVPKVCLSNDCIFNCAYCACRSTHEGKHQYITEPRALAELAVRQALQNNHGIFITSAIAKNPDFTQERILETTRIIRDELHYGGYVHAKVMPGADPELIRRCGRLVNRLSVNIEVAKSEGYLRVAKNKNKRNILTPMGQISAMIQEAKAAQGRWAPSFATTQSTQLMAGAANEDDQTILRLAQALYSKYALRRVYYTAFTYRHPAKGYDHLPPTATPTWRMARLYQADYLLREYGFDPSELAPADAPMLHPNLDPKIAWALRNLHRFPLEINTAAYEDLLRVPGIGTIGARRILAARRYGPLSYSQLSSIGIILKRSRHFITCNGKYQGAGCENQARLEGILETPVVEQMTMELR